MPRIIRRADQAQLARSESQDGLEPPRQLLKKPQWRRNTSLKSSAPGRNNGTTTSQFKNAFRSRQSHTF
jgi:hypothetical protein